MSPSVKKALRLSALGILLVVAILIALVFLVRWRTIVAWNDFKTHWEAQGEHFDIEHFIPDPVPDEENLAMHPLFERLWPEGIESNPTLASIDPTLVPGFNTRLQRSSLQKCQFSDFSAWGELENDLSTEAQDLEILRRLGPLEEGMTQVAAALDSHPHCQFPLEWHNVFARETEHLFAFLNLSNAFHLRAELRLRTNQPDLAVNDLVTIQQLATAAGREQSLVAHLVDLALQLQYLNGMWLGLADHRFDERQLTRLESLLPPPNFHASRLLHAIRFERAGILQFVDTIGHGPTGRSSGSSPSQSRFLSLWLASNRLALSEDIQHHQLAPGGTIATRPTLPGAQAASSALEDREKGIGKYTQSIALMAAPAYVKAVARSLTIEANITNARLAIALERYRLKHNAYPPSLADLVPAFLPTLPTDLINSRPIEYRLKPDGTPLIYQWGCDGDDDGGRPRKDPLHGDIVWQYTIDPPLTEEEFRRED